MKHMKKMSFAALAAAMMAAPAVNAFAAPEGYYRYKQGCISDPS